MSGPWILLACDFDTSFVKLLCFVTQAASGRHRHTGLAMHGHHMFPARLTEPGARLRIYKFDTS